MISVGTIHNISIIADSAHLKSKQTNDVVYTISLKQTLLTSDWLT